MTLSPETIPCYRCAGLGHCRVYSFTAQKLVEGECPVCEGSGEVEAPEPVVDLLGTAAVAVAFVLGMWIVAIAL